MIHRKVLRRPLLYLSRFLKGRRGEYYDWLTAVRDRGDWEGWLRFFLRGVAETAEEATITAERTIDLRERHRAQLQSAGLGANHLRLLDLLFQNPILNARLTSARLSVSFDTAGRLVGQLEKLGLLQEVTGGQRYRRYRYGPYLALFEDAGPNETNAPEQRANE